MADLAIHRFFETPLIRQGFAGDLAGLARAVEDAVAANGNWQDVDPMLLGEAGSLLVALVVGLADRFSVDAHARPPRHVWGLSLAARVVPAGASTAPQWDVGAYWSALIRLAGTAQLRVEDPRMPMRAMHEPGIHLRAPDGAAEEGAHSAVPLAPGELLLLPGWLRRDLLPSEDAPTVELSLSLFARLAP